MGWRVGVFVGVAFFKKILFIFCCWFCFVFMFCLLVFVFAFYVCFHLFVWVQTWQAAEWNGKMPDRKNYIKVLGNLWYLNLNEDIKDRFLKDKIIQQYVKCTSNFIILAIFTEKITFRVLSSTESMPCCYLEYCHSLFFFPSQAVKELFFLLFSGKPHISSSTNGAVLF